MYKVGDRVIGNARCLEGALKQYYNQTGIVVKISPGIFSAQDVCVVRFDNGDRRTLLEYRLSPLGPIKTRLDLIIEKIHQLEERFSERKQNV